MFTSSMLFATLAIGSPSGNHLAPWNCFADRTATLSDDELDSLAITLFVIEKRRQKQPGLVFSVESACFYRFGQGDVPDKDIRSMSYPQLYKLIRLTSPVSDADWQKDVIPQAIQRVASLFWKVEDPKAMEVLIGCLDDKRGFVNEAALHQIEQLATLRRLGSSLLALGRPFASALRTLGEASESHAAFQYCSILESFPEVGGQATPILLRILQHPKTEENMRIMCMFTLAAIGSRQQSVPEELARRLENARDDAHDMVAIAALVKLCPDHPQTLTALNKALVSESFFSRFEAFQSLFKLGQCRPQHEKL